MQFDNIKYYQFANIDPAYADYQITDSLPVKTVRISYCICQGILEGLQEILAIPEFDETARMIMLELGLLITAGVVLAPAVVLPALETAASFVGLLTSAYMSVLAGHNIYSTAAGTGTVYERARGFAKDGIILLVSAADVRGSAICPILRIGGCRASISA